MNGTCTMYVLNQLSTGTQTFVLHNNKMIAFCQKGYEGVDASRCFRVFEALEFEVLKMYPPKLGLAIGADTLGDPVFDQPFAVF